MGSGSRWGCVAMSVILLVDDSPEVRELYTDVLERLGHLVIQAVDGAQALVLAREFLPDLVLTDLRLPRMDGCELSRRLRDDPRLHDVPVLLHSAEADPKEPDVTAFLSKPCELSTLEARVTELLEHEPLPDARLRSNFSNRRYAPLPVSMNSY